jgi:hypothetical protein
LAIGRVALDNADLSAGIEELQEISDGCADCAAPNDYDIGSHALISL